MKTILKICSNQYLIIEKKALLLFLFKNNSDLLNELGFLKSDINRLNEEFKNILMEENEENLDYIKNEEEAFIERILNK